MKTCRKCNIEYHQVSCPVCKKAYKEKYKKQSLENTKENTHNCILCGVEKLKGFDCKNCQKIKNPQKTTRKCKACDNLLKLNEICSCFNDRKIKQQEYQKNWREKNISKYTTIYYENSKPKKQEYFEKNPMRKFYKSKITEFMAYEELEWKYIHADKNCAYCNIKLSFSGLSQTSIDRFDSNISYTLDNIRFTCLFCNLAKSQTKFHIFEDFINALRGNETYISKYIQENIPWNKINNRHLEISIDWVKNQYKKQDGKCFYSDLNMIHLDIHYFPFKISIERLDSNKDHVPDNCVLVCLGMNLGKNNKSVQELLEHLKLIKNL